MVVIWRLRYLSAKDNNLICVRKDRNNSLNFQIFRQLFLSGSQSPLTHSFCFFIFLVLGLIGGRAGDACFDDAVADGVELFVGGLEETLGGRLAVDGVDHYLLGHDRLDRL